uniref:DUF659 domain-containing protein n=1 Tax=Schizaphis graminum TaxID=13262 RepID=A0A2S2P4F1_SCHGA
MRHLKTKHVTVPLKRPLLVNDDNIDDASDPDVPASTSASVSTGSSRVNSEAAGPSPSNLQITKFIVKHFHPFSLVEETEFRNLIKMLAPNYIVPYDVSAVSLTTDGWTSINNQHYIALTVHFLNSETKLCSRLIGCINYNEQVRQLNLPSF